MSTSIVLFDAHVHVYPGVDVASLLDSAARQFGNTARLVAADRWQGILLLTEVVAVEWFDSVANAPAGCTFGTWQVRRLHGEDISLQASTTGSSLTLVAGRQIVTAERLELHALGTRAKFADGANVRVAVEAARAAGALTVLPWGAGKWLGARGNLVQELLVDPKNSDVLVSDNGGRPALWREPRLSLAAGRPMLRGSDPLPLPGEERRVGGFGCWFAGTLPTDAPATALFERISAIPAGQLQAYGAAETPWRFARNQLLLRLQRHRSVNK